MNLVGDRITKPRIRDLSLPEPVALAESYVYEHDKLPSNTIVVRSAIKTYIRRDWGTIGANQALWQEIADE